MWEFLKLCLSFFKMAMMDEQATSYFASMSKLAGKIIEDCETIKATYGDSWNELAWDKQEELLNKELFDPEIIAKYSGFVKTDEPPKLFPHFENQLWRENCGWFRTWWCEWSKLCILVWFVYLGLVVVGIVDSPSMKICVLSSCRTIVSKLLCSVGSLLVNFFVYTSFNLGFM